MKKQIFIACSVLFTAGMIFMAGCAKNDTSAPTVSLKGSSSMTISLNTTTSDPGATAKDDEDGDITASVTSDWSTKVDVNLKGTVTVTYSVSDAAGNTGTVERTVTVVNDADFLIGNYGVTETCQTSPVSPYNASITTSNTQNKIFSISDFGGFYPNPCTSVYSLAFTISGTSVNSTLSWSGQALCGNATVMGNAAYGSGSLTNATPSTLSIVYKWDDGTATEVCTGLYTKK
ncbi:MAG: DUF5011 domain-containing protein [Bacteroidota bacterium]